MQRNRKIPPIMRRGKKIQSVKTDPEMIQMIELVECIKVRVEYKVAARSGKGRLATFQG